MIFDNALVAYETIHAMKNKTAGRDCFMALKLDMSKAYDRVEWDYLEGVLQRMGFSPLWVSLLMACVRTVRYSVVVNGIQCGKIVPLRGLRQGDPISPYLFLICVEGFSGLLNLAETEGKIRGVSVARGAPRVSHLLFADDSLLFLRASIGDCEAILDLLHRYEVASGQLINIDKSAIFFSSNSAAGLKQQIMHCLGVTRVLAGDRYLGLPIMIGRAKKLHFGFIKDRLRQRVSHWQWKLLSTAGRGVLIQAVAQSIPVYAMSCFMFLISFLQDLTRIISKFWWSNGKDGNRIHWLSWSQLCLSKLDGGLGFRDFEAFNLAFLAKQGWHLMHNPHTLCHQVFKARYFPSSCFLDAGLGRMPSFVWRSLLKGREVLVAGSCWKLGDGNMVSVAGHRWLPRHPFSPRLRVDLPSWYTVSYLIDGNSKSWREDVVRSVIHPEDAEAVLDIPLGRLSREDKLRWISSSIGQFTMKSAYHVAREVLGYEEYHQDVKDLSWKILWTADVVPKVKIFLWRLLHGILPTRVSLRLRHVDVQEECCVCGMGSESGYHVFFECGFSKLVWGLSCDWLAQFLLDWSDAPDFWLRLFIKAKQRHCLQQTMVMLWSIWSNRNRCLHEGVCRSPHSLVAQALAYVEAYEDGLQHLYGERRVEAGSSMNLRWIPPIPGMLKLNCDAAFFVATGQASLGAVIRNAMGDVVLGGVARVDQVHGVMHAEALAVLWGLEIAWEYGYNALKVESDSSGLISELQKAELSLWDDSFWLEEIISIADGFDSCSFSYINRRANCLAHNITKYDCTVGEQKVWVGFLPSTICNPDISC